MLLQNFFILSLILACSCGQQDKNNGNPYEFGFTIDGEQHRHETRDTKGIVQGEFGFITADGIYHVTVYATDENGKFKILSMRNLRISAPLDGSSFVGEISPEAEKYRKKAGLPPIPVSVAPAVPAAQPIPNALTLSEDLPEFAAPAATPQSAPPFRFTTQPTIKPACASCGFVTTQKPIPGAPANGFQFQNPIFQKQDKQSVQTLGTGIQNQGQQHSQEQQQLSEGPGPIQQYPQSVYPGSPENKIPQYQPVNGPQNTNYNSVGKPVLQLPGFANVPNKGTPHTQSNEDIIDHGISQGSGSNSNTPVENNVGVGQSNVDGSSDLNRQPNGVTNSDINYVSENEKDVFNENSGSPMGPQTNLFGGGSPVGGTEEYFPQGIPHPNPLQLSEDVPSSLPPISVGNGVIHVDGNQKQDIPIKDKFPGMQDGLPAGIEETDITDLLYKFHYTVGFHGHYEKGLKNGAKIGGYFVNGRDGISRVVTYIADENGYRPKVKFINLGLSSDDTPKPETEKTFGLKSFEFIWYPIA